MKKICALLLSACLVISPFGFRPGLGIPDPDPESTSIEISPFGFKPGPGWPDPDPDPGR